MARLLSSARSDRGPACEPIELRRAVVDVTLALAGGLELARREHAATKRVLVQRAREDGLVHPLQVEEGEARWEELEPDRCVVQLPADPLHRHAEDLGVVEGEGQGRPVGAAGVDRAAGLALPGYV